jgi:tetratricopeptide (TPR) repeat protein
MTKNYYELLGIDKSATTAEIKTAYKKLALLHHPDRNGSSPESEELFKHINEAYTVLSNPDRRQSYDFGYFYTPPAPTYTYTPTTPIEEEVIEENNHNYLIYYTIIGVIVCAIIGFVFFFFMEKLSAEQDNEQARIALQARDYKKALHYAKMIQSRNGVDENEHADLLADVYFATQQYQQALYYYQAIPQTDTSVFVRLQIARCHTALENYFAAAQNYDYLVAKQKISKEIALEYGELLCFYLAKPKKAIYYFDLFPDEQTAKLGKGVALLQTDTPNEGITLLEQMLSQNPATEEAAYYLGIYYLKEEKTHLACPYFTRAYQAGIKKAEIGLKKACP